ncbi:MAG: hypothetical protein Q9224_004190, partial [Gallowayella concinna]
MAQFAKTTVSHASYAAFRPTYSAALYGTVLAYHNGQKSLCIDLGTGHGLVARSLAPRFDKIIGTDPSKGMIQQAISLTPNDRFANVSFQEASAESLPFLQDSSVDMVVAAQAAHWFDYERLFPEMKRVLRKGGTVAFWGYSDPVFVDYPRATTILNHYAYGDSTMLLGPYWSQPGRSIVRDRLRTIQPPAVDWNDIQRIEYEPGTEGVRSGRGAIFLHRRIKLGDCMNYIRTWSSFHAWQEAHPEAQRRVDGGGGDVVDEIFNEMRSAEPHWQGDDWEEMEVEVEWPTAGNKRRSPSSATHRSTPEKPAKKPTLFEAADERPSGSRKANEEFLSQFENADSDTSLSDVSSADFEDVAPQPTAKRRKLEHHVEDNEEMDWEDAVGHDQVNEARSSTVVPSGDLVLTLDDGTGTSCTASNNLKKGPSKIERQIRVVTHCIHVQFLLFHNSLRSRFACDAELQKIIIDQLPPVIEKEVDTWKLASGLPQEVTKTELKKPRKEKGRKGNGKYGGDVRSQRDWGKPAERQEKGAPNMSRGDPVIRLLKILAAYWKKRFTITAPGLRKQGYKSASRLEAEIASFKCDKHDLEEHGERIGSLGEFKECAKKCEGSRDVGVQLFVALLRGLGLEARLVASFQPVGFGWNKNEEANPKKKRSVKAHSGENPDLLHTESTTDKKQPKSTSKLEASTAKTKATVANGSKYTPIDLSDPSSSELSSAGEDDDDDESVVDVTPSTPRKKPNMPYDRDLVFPTYWAEVVSPITHEVYPVDPLILIPAVATNPEHLAPFEPRGAKADKAKQVFGYVVAYSPDGSAKDVTIRYLKKHMWPGRTKGVRLPVEKIPVYNSKGKIKHHEEYDWFKTVMSGYTRPDHMRTAVDDIEEAKDLKVVKPEKKASKANEGTLQFYKTSAEYVLERHLRREEAIIPSAEPVKTFTTGKGDDTKDEPVFLRKDIMVCRTGESWHKEGRQIKAHQHPMKMVPIRAVTLTRKREVQEAEREGGEKLKQGLYAWEQTEWIIPPPIVDGVIPKNGYGNMDCFVPTMVPEGAVHVPLRSTAKICKRLNIDFAEAVTGFEFGKQRAVPVITGVVVAAEHEEMVIGEWEKDEEERRIKEEGKREKVALGMWRKFVMGLRIIERVRDEYGDAGGEVKEEFNPFTNRNKQKRVLDEDREMVDAERDSAADRDCHDDNMAGGFLADGKSDSGGGFLPDGYEDNRDLEIETETAPAPNGFTTHKSSTATIT